jgi:DNA-binding transcriptional LysR family regulator
VRQDAHPPEAALLLRRHNLNLVPILRELLRTRSVSRTAERVGLSQSAVSAALARLRETFEDDLLVMVGRRLELTEKGAQLIEQTERAHLELEALLRPPQFDPLTETRRFVVASADYITFVLAPRLARLLGGQAPHASVPFVDVPPDLALGLTRGTIDTVIAPDDTAGDIAVQMLSAPLFTDEFVVIGAADRWPPGSVTREAYEDAAHAMFQMSPRLPGSHQALGLAEQGVVQRNRVVVQQFSALPAIVEAADCLAICHRRLAEQFAKAYAISIHPAPFELAPLSLRAYWSRSVQRDPAHVWFRGVLQQAAQLA